MVAKEIDEKINNGESLCMCFGLWGKNSFKIGDNRITEKQYDLARKRFEGKLVFTGDYGGLTKHYYKLNKPNN